MKTASKNDSAKKNAGYKAAEYVEDGMVLGLGTGSTTHYFIEKVGMKMAEEGIKVQGIPTSFQSLLLAKKWNIPITTLEENDVDLSVDGADEVDGDFNLIKGGGAAHTKEKIVDYAAEKFIVIVDESKVVEKLGTFPVPVEVIPDASRIVIQTLEDMGAECEIRMAQRKDGPVITDNGNFVIDAKFAEIASPQHLEIDLNSIPGVVENGIFSQMVDKVIVGTSDGTKEL
ncbi:ribose-5-phosphate isomerase RpiA [Methanobrevibacter millerae]|uniref:Ribose-5-phosphate isomerase A n=1 Tax=Methanobrevibacter millerae TaxID=230361 RepID=A0A1G5X5N1_9EURY|nr:ribose-5-phosphate isomerase RpiA [Methanobrevibacter millerae]SDA65723.1 ribose-5-phosphate isomerase [Methanobrevibacter millerae]